MSQNIKFARYKNDFILNVWLDAVIFFLNYFYLCFILPVKNNFLLDLVSFSVVLTLDINNILYNNLLEL